MQISVTRDTFAGHAGCPWLVVVPRRLSTSGRRQYRRFSTRTAAAAFAASLREQVRTSGEQRLAAVPADLAADAQAAVRLLEGTGLTLTDAVHQLLERGQDTGVAIPCIQSSGGAGVSNGQVTDHDATAGEAITLNAMLSTMENAKCHHSTATRRNRHNLARVLFSRVPALANTPLQDCTPAMLERALDTCWAHSPHTWNAGRSLLSSVFAYAIKRQLFANLNPVSAIDSKHVEEKEICALPPANLRALFAACRHATDQEISAAAGMSRTARARAMADTSGVRCYIAICAFAGVRPAECSRITWGDIDWEDGVLSVRASNSKTGGCRHIELHPTLRAWLEAYRPANAGPLDLIAPEHRLALLLHVVRLRAGYTRARPWPHDCLRHSYATYYLKAGGNLQQLQLFMGHRDLNLLYTRYTNMRGVTRAMAEEWWQITPDTVDMAADTP